MPIKGHTQAFTLIELLVVISIIAVLSGVVLASLNTAREKGRIAAGRQAEAGIYHAAGDQTVGAWDFDECSGSTATDRSGYGGVGTLTGGATWSTDTPTGTGCSISFDGSTGYVNVPNNSNLEIGTNDVTVAAWIKTSGAANMTVVEHGSAASYSLRMGGAGLVRFNVNSATVGTSTLLVNDGKWHFIVGVDQRSAGGYVCVDGICGATNAIASTGDITNGSVLTIGQGSVGYFNGKIDSVKIYAKTLTASEIRDAYASEASLYAQR